MYTGACVYALIAPNTKMYVGQSKQYATRMGQHERGALRKFDGIWEKTTYVYNAIRCHKWKNMHLYIFETFDKNRPDIQEILNEREMFYIAKYKTTDRRYGYNLTKGGDGNKGHKWTKEQLARITEIRNTPEWRLNCSEKQKAAWAREDVREKHRLALEKPGAKEAHRKACIEAQNRPEVKAAARARMMGNKNSVGKKLTDEQKRKIGDHFRGKKQSKEHVEKRASAIRGQKRTAEQRKVNSEAQKIAQNRPEVVAKKRKAALGNTNRLGYTMSDEELVAHRKRMKSSKTREKCRANSAHSKKVIALKNGIETEYRSCHEASRQLSTESCKYNFQNISLCCKNKYNGGKNTYKGITFRFKNPESRKRKRKD